MLACVPPGRGASGVTVCAMGATVCAACPTGCVCQCVPRKKKDMMRMMLGTAALGAALRAPVPAATGLRGAAPPRAAAAAVSQEVAPPLEWSPAGVRQRDGTLVSRSWTAVVDGAGGVETRYVAVGDAALPPVLLIHGFGASSFHWRRNANALAAAGYRVYAIDLLGFGASDKPLVDYGVDLWVAQCAAFLDAFAGGKHAVVAGNSIGGNVALALAARRPDLVRGVASLNGAGTFSAAAAAAAEAAAARAAAPAWRRAADEALGAVAAAAKRFVVAASFVVTKQPARIRQVLRQVYPVAPEACDDELVASIEFPARDRDAPEVFYRIVTRDAGGVDRSVEAFLDGLAAPLLLCWGEKDPWCTSAVGDRLLAAAEARGVAVERASVDAGHCPNDEQPVATNAALLEWMGRLKS